MQLIRNIADHDFFAGEPKFLNEISRVAARGVLYKEGGNIAMMEMTTNGLLKLPGGGLELGETPEEAFLREVEEETGYSAEILQPLGYIDEHKGRNQFWQRSYCYLAKVSGQLKRVTLTDHERKLGMKMQWISVREAAEQLQQQLLLCKNYSARRAFMLARDLTIVKLATNCSWKGY